MTNVNRLVENRVEELRSHTNSRVEVFQKSKIPSFGNIILYGKKYYMFDGYKYPTRDINTQSYLAVNLPYTQISNKNTTYIDNMINLIINNQINPFILFIQNKFIKWSDITIVKDHNYSYIIIHNIDNYKEYDTIENIALPCYIRYGELNKTVSNLAITFTSDGKFNPTNTNIDCYIDIIDKNINGESIKLDSNNFYFSIDSEQLISKDNFIIFKNNIPYKNGINKIINKGLNIFEYSDRDELINNIIIIKVYYYTNSNLVESIIKNVDKNEIKNDIIDEIINKEEPHYLDNIKTIFDFQYNKNKNYSDNLLSAINYIMEYDSKLFNKTYLEISNIKSELYTGKEILNMCDSKGFLHMFRKNKEFKYDTFVIIFKNNKIFENYFTIKYLTNMLEVFIDNKITDTDNIEMLFFSRVCNNEQPIIINKNTPIYLSEPYNIDELTLYSDTVENPEYDIYNEYNCIQYKVDFDYVKQDDKFNIIFKNDWFYGKELSMITTRQFRYCYNNILKDQLHIVLSPEFKFCHEIEKYMIFINGQKLDPDQYRLTTMDNDLPFNELAIYTDIIMKPGDKIEAFYIPDDIKNTIIRASIPNTGTIEVDMNKLSYNFSKELYFIFVNGMKINPNDITDVGRNRIKIKNNIGSINNLCIIEYIDTISILTNIFINSNDLWTQFINSLTEDEYEKLIKGTIITDTFEDMKTMQTTSKAVIYEIINNYYRLDGIINNKSDNEILYAYNKEVIDENDYDENGNYIIRVADSNIIDKAAIYNTTKDEIDDNPSYNYERG